MNITVGPAHVPGAGSGGNRMQNKNGNNDSEIIGKFSVALGLFDYINPIFYGITVITIMANLPVCFPLLCRNPFKSQKRKGSLGNRDLKCNLSGIGGCSDITSVISIRSAFAPMNTNSIHIRINHASAQVIRIHKVVI